jgi:dipeptidyl aminopeptidase/acylaminoacyl peptidase
MVDFGDLHEYAWAPRVGSVALSPDGTRVALAMQTVGVTPPKYLTSIWRVDTEPGSVPVRLTRSAEGEGSPAFLPDGSLAFVSRRPDGTASGGPGEPAAKDAKSALWLLPAGGGEARRIAAPGGGVSGVSAARAASVLAYSAATFRGHQVGEEDAALRKARTDAGVAAILHDSGRLRHWDHDLGAEQLRLLGRRGPGAGRGRPGCRRGARHRARSDA